MDRAEFEVVLSEHAGFVNAKIVDFFAEKQWEQLDESLKRYLQNCSFEEVVRLLNSEYIPEDVPESLKDVKTRLKKLEYNRKSVMDPNELWEKWTASVRKSGLEKQFQVVTSSNSLIRKRIKAKKQHEIDRIVELVSQIQLFQKEKLAPVDSLVDIGAGVGHLSRMISLKNGLKVMAVEGNQQFTVAANSLDEQLVKESAKIGSGEFDFSNSPLRFTNFVTDDLCQKIDEFSEKAAILVGLHCCGDFSSTILRVFRKSRKAKALVLFGCCYHKQFQCFHFLNPTGGDTEQVAPDTNTVFPLSQKWKGCDLSYVAREMACHNNENVSEKQKTDISRYARAHLEAWIRKITDDPQERNIGMCSVKCEEDRTTFEEYIRKAMAKRGSHLLDKVLETIPLAVRSVFVSQLQCSRFEVYDVIRLLFAPSIESAIIDDRLAYLEEHGINSRVVPLFDPKISPRNLAIVAYKDC